MGYIMKLRKKVGSRPIIMTGSCILIINDKGEILLQHRTDNDKWGFIGGSLELEETFEEAAKREAFEESGIIIEKMELFNIYSGKEMYNKYPNGDEVYNSTVMFKVLKYSGVMKADRVESKELKFFSLDKLPKEINPPDIYIIEDIKKTLGGNKDAGHNC